MLLRCIEIYWVILPRANFLLRPAQQAETRELAFPLCQVPGAAAGLQPQHCAMAGLARRPSPAAASRVWDFMMPDKVPVAILFPLSALLLRCCVGWQLPGDRTGALHPTPFPFEAPVILPMPSPFPPLPFPWRGRGPTCPGSERGLAATSAVPLALLPACLLPQVISSMPWASGRTWLGHFTQGTMQSSPSSHALPLLERQLKKMSSEKKFFLNV